jgi:hypothetical protein
MVITLLPSLARTARKGLEEDICGARVMQIHVLEKNLLSTLPEGTID